jgi:hypothetical protein
MLKKIGIICLSCLLSLTALQGCASGRTANDFRFSHLEFELNRVTSRIDRLESKLDLLSWSVSPPIVGKTVFETDSRGEQMEKLLVDLKAQIARLQEQLAQKSN